MIHVLNATVLFFALRAAYSAAAVVMLRMERRHHNGRGNGRHFDMLEAMLERKKS